MRSTKWHRPSFGRSSNPPENARQRTPGQQSVLQEIERRPTQAASTKTIKSGVHYASIRSVPRDGILSVRPKHHPVLYWKPSFLRRRVLVAFAILFALFSVGLQVLYAYSSTHRGIASSSENKHYLWTYVPTAVFVIATVLWRQTDYAAKSIQPWKEMAKGSVVAEHSLLLDYVTPFQVLVLWRALRNRHFLVVTTITVFLSLKTITIISTSMLSLQPAQVDRLPTSIRLLQSFSGSTFRSGAYVDSRPAYAVDGIQSHNLSHPIGTTDQYAVEIFSTNHPVSEQTLTANVDVFRPSLECEPSYTTSTSAYYEDHEIGSVTARYNISTSAANCTIENVAISTEKNLLGKHHVGYFGQLIPVTCSNFGLEDPTRQRLMLSVWSCLWNGTDFDPISGVLETDNNTLINVTNVICVPSYVIQTGSVTLDVSGNVLGIEISDKSSHEIGSVTGYDIAQGVLRSLELFRPSVSSSKRDGFFELFADFPGDRYFDWQTLESTSKSLYSKLAVQIASTYLLKDNEGDITINGTFSCTVQRLVTRTWPVRLMQVISLLMTILTLLATLLAPKAFLPRPVDSVGALATILARSQSVRQLLRRTGHLDIKAIRQGIRHQRFSTVLQSSDLQPTFCLQTEPDALGGSQAREEIREVDETISLDKEETRLADAPPTAAVAPATWFLPFSFTIVAKVMTILSFIAAIAVLEVLLRQSGTHNGLMNIEDSSERYGWLCIPTLLLVLLGTMVNILDFDIDCLIQYQRLSSKHCWAEVSITRQPLVEIPIYKLGQAIRDLDPAMLAASISVLLAPLSTIVASGLFNGQPVPLVRPIQAQALDFFNNTSGNSDVLASFDALSLAPTLSSLVVESNMSYPMWTYNNIALPKIVANLSDISQPNTGEITVRTPAIMSGLDCTSTHQIDSFNASNVTTTATGGETIPVLHTNITIPPAECIYSSWSDTVDVIYSGYFGSFSNNADLNESCPLFAYFGQTSAWSVEYFSAFLCYPVIDHVEVDATFQIPDYTLSSPPHIIDGTTKPFSESYWVNYKLKGDLFSAFESLNITGVGAMNSFFQAIMYGKSALTGEEMKNSTRLAEAMNSFAGIFFAQQISANSRQPVAELLENQSGVPRDPLPGTYTDPARSRLVQSELSTRLLQAILGALLLCVGVVYLTVDMRKVIPKAPGTIAAVLSLMADSRFLDEKEGLIPPGAELMSDAEWEREGIWKGKLFRMGWWDEGEGRVFKIDVKPRPDA